MNTVETTEVVSREEEVESTSSNEFAAPRQPAPGTLRNTRLRFALLIGIALLAMWLGLTVRHSINEIDEQVQMIHENIMSSGH